MRLETLNTKEVRAAFIEQIVPILQQQDCTQKEFDGMTYFLDNFLTLLEGSNIMLIRATDDSNQIPVEQLQEQSKVENAVDVQKILDEEQLVDDEEEEPLSAEDAHFRAEYLKHLEQEVKDVEEPVLLPKPAQPTRFTDKIRQLKTPAKRNEEDDEDEY